jgi:hypothetical protein
MCFMARGLHDKKPLIFRRRREDKTLEKLKSQDIFPEYYSDRHHKRGRIYKSIICFY